MSDDHRAGRSPADESSASPDLRGAARPSAASALWAELREYRRRREAWECEFYRLLQGHRDLEARHWQLLLHAAEVAASAEEREAVADLLPPIGEGPRFEERLALFERSLLSAGLARTGGCRRRAAALLGLLPSTLCEKLKRLGMNGANGGAGRADHDPHR